MLTPISNLRKLLSRKRPRQERDDETLTSLLRLSDQLNELDHRVSRAVFMGDIETAESITRRLMKTLLKDRLYETGYQSKIATTPVASGLSAELHSWLLLSERTRCPAGLAEIVGRLTCAAHQLARDLQIELNASSLKTTLAVADIRNITTREFGMDVLRALAETRQGSIPEQTRTLLNDVRNLTLWPDQACTDSCTELLRSAKTLKSLVNEITEFRDCYDKARNAEVAAANLDAMVTWLNSYPTSGETLPRQTRTGIVSHRLSNLIPKANARAQSGAFAADVCRYANDVFQSLRNHWKSSLVAGAGLIIPAAVLKQYLVWFATHLDVSWASTLTKLDPVDGFKFPLVAGAIIFCGVAVWLSFHVIRQSAIQSLSNPDTGETYGKDRSASAFILRNATIAGLAWLGIYSGVAYWIWSGATPSSIASAYAAQIPETSDSTLAGTPAELSGGFKSVATFGDIRILRCALKRCSFGTRTFGYGSNISTRSDLTLLDAALKSNEPSETVVLSVLREPTTIVDGHWAKQDPEPKYAIDVSGAIALTGIPTNLPQPTLTVDDKSANAIGEAMGKALARTHFSMVPTQVRIDVPSLQQPLADLISAVRSEPSWPSKFLESANATANALASMSEAEKQRWLCDKKMRMRNMKQRVQDGVTGDDCDSPQ